MLSDRRLVETPRTEELPALAVRAAEYHCADCGYGAIVRHALPICPMCGGSRWEAGSSSGFGDRRS